MRYVRNIVLLVVIVAAFSGLAMADYYLRLETTGLTRRLLKEKEIELNADAVIQAVQNDDLDVLKSLEIAGVNLGEPGKAGTTALSVAVESGNSLVVDYLLGKKSVIQRLEHKGSDGQTALFTAMKGGDFSIAEKLIKVGAELGDHWEESMPLILAAVNNDDVSLFDFLRRHEVSVNVQNAQGRSPLVEAMREGKEEWVLRLLKAGAEVNQTGASGEPLLLEAVRKNKREVAKMLIEHGATVDIKNKAGETPLIVAVEKADREAISMLLDAGAKAESIDEKGRSIPDRLIEAGDVEMVMFFAARTDGEITDGWMVKVFEAGKTELLKGLLVKGGNVEAGMEKDGRLLKRAVLNKDRKMVELLLAHKADPKGEVWDALAGGDREILEKLLKEGADANEPLAVGLGSPLSLALRQRRYDTAELLLKYGANPNPPQANGRTMIEDAQRRLDARAVSLLRDHCADYKEEIYSDSNVGTSKIKEQKKNGSAR